VVALLPHRGLVWSLPLRVLGCALPQNTPSALLPRPAPRARRPPRALQTAAVVYMTTKMVMTRGVSVMLYIGYMLVASFTFFMFTGTVGFACCLTFVRVIYGAVKVE
jgi:hypothetical protein